MSSFLTKFAAVVRGVLSGFDRLFFSGSLRHLAHIRGMQNYLWANKVLYKDFAAHSRKVTAQLEEASLHEARRLGREIRYLNSAKYSKEDIARQIAARDRIRSGLICVLRSVDPCMSFTVDMNYQTHKLEVHYRQRKCMHYYHYQIHPIFGFMHTRIQTWFPFRVYVCINGREWLARQMDQAKLGYRRRDNTFTWVEDLAQAQALLNQQVHAHWPSLLGDLATAVNPAHHDMFAKYHCNYYWSVNDSEWASDVMFTSRAALTEVYPRFLQYATMTFGAAHVLRFLGQPVSAAGKVPHYCRHEVSSNVRERLDGVRIKHWVNGNSIKMYDKTSVLRVETLIHKPGDFKVYRAAQDDPEGPKDLRPLRLGVVDMPHRAAVSQAANERYLEAFTAVQETTPLRHLAEPLCRPAIEPARPSADPPPAAPDTAAPAPSEAETTPVPAPITPVRPRRVRALNPLAPADGNLLQAVSRHEFLINGLRNRDLRPILYPVQSATPKEQRRQAAAVTRQLRILRAHGLIEKIPKSHRYLVTAHGRRVITALLAARDANTDSFTRCAG